MSTLEEIEKVQREADLLHSEEQVHRAITRVAAAISDRLGRHNPVVLTVLNGGIPFAGHLLMQLRFPLEIDSIQATRYRGSTSGTEVVWLHRPSTSLQGRAVLIVDDILDEGVTLAEIIHYCREQGAASVHTAVLVDKKIGRERPCSADFVALEAENRYLFGYGMDYKHYLRNAPGIYACKQS